MSSRAERGSLSHRRHSAQFLTSLHIPPLDDSEPVRHVVMEERNSNMDPQVEVIVEGEALFKEFLLQEIKNESSVDLNEAPMDLLEEEFLRTAQNYPNQFFANTGWKLRQMADEFARSQERQAVRQRADQVEVDAIYEQFRDRLSQLFEGGVTTERIIAIFYFCSDVVINALHSGTDVFQRFLTWSLSFIAENVCQWVHSHGGWRQVLMPQLNSVYKLGCFASLSVILVLMIRYFR